MGARENAAAVEVDGAGGASAASQRDDTTPVIDLLRNSIIFGNLDDDSLSRLALHLAPIELPAGDELFHKGDASDALYLVVNGSVRIHDGEFTFTTLPPRYSFGDYSLLGETTRTASVTACEDTHLLRLDRRAFDRFVRDDTAALHGILKAMLERIRDKDNLEAELAKRNAEIRRQHDRIADQHEALQNQEQALRELNATKDRFLSIVTHDLKNPFTALGWLGHNIDGYSETGLPPEKTAEYASALHSIASNACRFLDNLLEWSQYQTGRITLSPYPVSIHRVVSECTGLLSGNASEKDIDLQNGVPQDLKVYADSRAFSMVVRNLLCNAIKYSHRGGTVCVSAREEDARVRLEVADHGIGITQEGLSQLFRTDSHYRSRGTAGEEGTGLGLILCKEFVERSNGSINVESEVGKGSTFIVLLPKA